MGHVLQGRGEIMFHQPKKTGNEQKIIIFDSPDGTGKTNIAYGLSVRLGIPYFKMNTEHENWRKGKFKEALEFDQTYLLQFLKQTGYSVVIDRAYPAEWVYSDVFRRETNTELLTNLDAEFAKLGTNIIIPVREDYSSNRKDELVDFAMLPKLHDKYLEFRDFTKCKTITIYVDSYKENLQAELDALIPELNFGPFSYDTFDVVLHRTIRNKFTDEDVKKASKEYFDKLDMSHFGRQRLKP
jgi:thymidylate kinase